METLDNTIKYYELLMSYDDTSKNIIYELPSGFHYEFYQTGDEADWIQIHIESGEFTSIEEGLKIFHDFYHNFLNELYKRCVFIVDDGTNEKIGTATISLLKNEERGYNGAVDWVAIKKSYQGRKLSRPLISKFVQMAKDLGHDKIILHTQTTTWLAAKLYLDFGFEPLNTEEEIGWKILKTLTNHQKLDKIENISKDDIYDKRNIQIEQQVKQIFQTENFNYSVWYKNGLHNVYIYYNCESYEYEYYEENGIIKLKEITNKICKTEKQVNFKKIRKQEFDSLKRLFPDSEEMWLKYREKRLHQFDINDTDIYVIEHNDAFVGEVSVNYSSHALKSEAIPNQRVYLEAFRLDRNYRGFGFGQSLIEYTLDDLEKQGYFEFTIGVEDDNEIAKHIYSKLGFNEAIDKGYGNEFDPCEYTLFLKDTKKMNKVARK